MEHVLSVIVAVATLSVPQTGMTNAGPIAVGSCSVSDPFNSASVADLLASIPLRTLQLSFLNTQDSVATKVVFDVFHDGTHTIETEHGHFSKGVPIERLYESVDGAYTDGPAACSVTSVSYADGTTWTPAPTRDAMAPSGVTLH